MLGKEFNQSYLPVLAAEEFFTAAIWTASGLMTYYVLVFMRVTDILLLRGCMSFLTLRG